jgi:DNA-binding GntR family transcriptional regulator
VAEHPAAAGSGVGEFHRIESLSRVAYEEIRDRIIDGRISEDARLRERELAEMVGVSRVPVREAIPLLEAAGYLTSLGRRGLIVAPLSIQGTNDVYDLRASLESLAARRAAERATAAGSARVRKTLDAAFARLEEGDLIGFTAANSDFHLAIEALAANEMLSDMMVLVRERNLRLNRVGIGDSPRERHREHTDIADAIFDGNAELASALAFAHVEHVRRRTLASLRSSDRVDA